MVFYKKQSIFTNYTNSMAKKNKEESIDLSKFLYSKEYGLGSWLGENIVPLAQTAAGTALTATGAATPIGIGLMAQGTGSIGANAVAKNDSQAAANIAGMSGLAGSLGSAAASGSFKKPEVPNNNMQVPAGYAEGGQLTEYNGNLHEDGGIALGNTGNEVEDKETRWEDYIFSEKVKVPGKKYSFSDASKRINKKYSQRENDQYDKKALDREMKALMGMQEAERNRMGLSHQKQMEDLFACGGKMKHPDGGVLDTNPITLPVDTNDSTLVAQPLPGITQQQLDVNNAISGDITQLSQVPNTLKLTPGNIDKSLYPELDSWKPSYDPSGTKLDLPPTHPVYKAMSERNKRIVEFRKYTGQTLELPLNQRGLPDATQIDPNFYLSKEQMSQLDPEKVKQYYDDLRWKNAYRQRAGFPQKQYYGDVEGQQQGYTADTPLEDLNFGIRFLTGAQSKDLKEMGGQIKYANGGSTFKSTSYDYNDPTYYENFVNPEIAALGTMSENDNATMVPYSESSPTSVADAINGMGYVEAPQETGSKQGWKEAGIFAAQNLGNIYNIAQGMQTPDKVQYDKINPSLVSANAARNAAASSFDQAGSIGRENIRRHATSSGQALSNIIAQNTAIQSNKAKTLAQIEEDVANRNAVIANSTKAQNANIAIQEEIANTQTEAARQNAMATGLVGMGTNIASFARDRKATNLQDSTIQNFLRTGEYHIGKDSKGNDILIHTASGKPVNQ